MLCVLQALTCKEATSNVEVGTLASHLLMWRPSAFCPAADDHPVIVNDLDGISNTTVSAEQNATLRADASKKRTEHRDYLRSEVTRLRAALCPAVNASSRVAIVGNDPITHEQRTSIAAADLVIRREGRWCESGAGGAAGMPCCPTGFPSWLAADTVCCRRCRHAHMPPMLAQ